MLSIRPYRIDDLPQLRQICIDTTLMEVNERSRQFIPLLWCDYYAQHEGDNVFVLDDDGVAVGYVLCSTSKDYYKVMKRDYLPQVKQIDVKMYVGFRLAHAAESALSHRYDAHLHIDILPPYQRGGWGSRLIDALVAHLKAKGCHSVFLGCSSRNVKGVNFYRKYGFKQVKRYMGSIVFALEF